MLIRTARLRARSRESVLLKDGVAHRTLRLTIYLYSRRRQRGSSPWFLSPASLLHVVVVVVPAVGTFSAALNICCRRLVSPRTRRSSTTFPRSLPPRREIAETPRSSEKARCIHKNPTTLRALSNSTVSPREHRRTLTVFCSKRSLATVKIAFYFLPQRTTPLHSSLPLSFRFFFSRAHSSRRYTTQGVEARTGARGTACGGVRACEVEWRASRRRIRVP